MGLTTYTYTLTSEVNVTVKVRAENPEAARQAAYDKAGARYQNMSTKCNMLHGDISIGIPDPKDPEGAD